MKGRKSFTGVRRPETVYRHSVSAIKPTGPLDLTRTGSLGAFYATGGRSQIFTNDAQFRVTVDVNTSYFASSRVDADRPGGEGEGSLISVVELVMPADQLEWRIAIN